MTRAEPCLIGLTTIEHVWRVMTAIAQFARDSGSRSQSHDPQGHGPEAGRAAAESGIAQTKAVP